MRYGAFFFGAYWVFTVIAVIYIYCPGIYILVNETCPGFIFLYQDYFENRFDRRDDGKFYSDYRLVRPI